MIALSSGAKDGTIQGWDPRNGTRLFTFKQNSSGVNGLTLVQGPDCHFRGPAGACDYVLAAQQDRPSIHAWTWPKDALHLRCSTSERIGPLAVSKDGVFCCGGGASGRLYVWELGTGELLRVLGGHYKQVSSLAFSSDGAYLISGGQDAMVHVWSMATLVDEELRSSTTCEAVHTWTGHSLPVTGVFCGEGGINGRVATSSLDHTCKIWSLASGKLLHSVSFPAAINAVLMDPAECLLVAAGA